MMTDEERLRFYQLIQEREQLRRKTTRKWNARSHWLGGKGEVAMCDKFGAIPDLRNNPGGDNGIDLLLELAFSFSAPRWVPLDAKTANGPAYLLTGTDETQSGGKTHPHVIYVLCRGNGDGDEPAEVLRWEWGHVMLTMPTKYWESRDPKTGELIPNDKLVHYRAFKDLRPLEELLEAYTGRWRHQGQPPQLARYTVPLLKPRQPIITGRV